MATSVIPALIDSLVAQATAALPSITVVDGPGATDEPGDYLLIGVADPNQADDIEAATSDESWAALGQRARDEAGAVTCIATAWNGDGDQKAARDLAFTTVAAVNAMLVRPTTDPTCIQTLVPGVVHALVGHQRVIQNNYEGGAVAVVTFDVRFQARI